MNDIVPLFGLETEYGIIREDQEKSDPVEESMQLLKACELQSAFGVWAYFRENTHNDMRGFHVDRLAQDEEEDEFCEQDRKRPYSYLEMKSDRVLVNGARFYNDHTHPEYSTPECRRLFQLVAHDLAGDADERNTHALRQTGEAIGRLQPKYCCRLSQTQKSVVHLLPPCIRTQHRSRARQTGEAKGGLLSSWRRGPI